MCFTGFTGSTNLHVLAVGLWQSRTWPDLGTQIRPEPDPDLGIIRFSDHRTMCLMKLMASSVYTVHTATALASAKSSISG